MPQDSPLPDDARNSLGVSERFRLAAHDIADAGSVELLPSRLAAVVSRVLDADAAGLSVLSDDFRVPLGASDDEARAAERLQFTVRQGPCWDAVRSDVPLAAGEAAMSQRWPEFSAELFRRTSFRSVVSVPLRLARGSGGAVDLYFRDAAASERFDLDDATVVAAHIADILNRTTADELEPAGSGALAHGPRWIRGPEARSRYGVWIAAGMLMSGSGQDIDLDDALELLRAVAYGEGLDIDDVAGELINGERTAEQVHRTIRPIQD